MITAPKQPDGFTHLGMISIESDQKQLEEHILGRALLLG